MTNMFGRLWPTTIGDGRSPASQGRATGLRPQPASQSSRSSVPNAERWDYRAVYRAVRARDHALSDRVSALMPQEADAQQKVDALRVCIEELGKSIAIVERAGGDATKLREQLAPITPELAAQEARLLALTEELRLIRASLKSIDAAHSAMHWACFAEAELARFDETRAASAAATRRAETEGLGPKAGRAARSEAKGDAPTPPEGSVQ